MIHYTTIEQSKKLLELGIDKDTADMEYMFHRNDGKLVAPSPFIKDGFENTGEDRVFDFTPCWSLTALLNLLPSELTVENEYSITTYSIRIRKYALTEDVDVYQIAYGSYKFYEDGNSSWKDMINTSEKENLIDAVFQMIIWLNENNKL